MTPLKLFFTLAIALAASLVNAENYGKYIGTVQAEWLEDGRKMRLLAPFSYLDPGGKEWQAPIGSLVDGASIPQLAWSVIGGPFEGKYRNSSVIHDVGCEQKEKPWEAVHEVFYWGMLASGVEIWRAKVMFAAVYHFGPRWPRLVTIRGLLEEQTQVAREEALAHAVNGSTAEIVKTRSYEYPFPWLLADVDEQRIAADFDVQITPPPMKLTEEDFSYLYSKILVGEGKLSRAGYVLGPPVRPLTLDDIRAYQPQNGPVGNPEHSRYLLQQYLLMTP